MRAAFVIESLTGNTWKAGELIADGLSQHGWSITGLSKVRAPDLASIQDADLVIVGTWVHWLFVVGQAPWAAAFCTFALNPGKSLDRLTGAVSATGADVIGGLALSRSKLEAHSETFCTRLLDAVAVPPTASVPA